MLPTPVSVYQKKGNTEHYHPRYIYDVLDRHVIGQESAKKSLSVVLHQHRIRYQKNLTNVKKTNCVLIGPSGCGKSLMINTLAKVLKIPCISVPATTIVQRGYRGGMHASDIARQLRDASKGNEQKTKYGIVMIDEIDKLAAEEDADAGDIASTGVQRDLLCIVDGYSSMKSSFDDDYEVGSYDTSNVLFIFAGAFHKITKYSYFSKEITHNDLIKCGLLPELVNRFGTIIPFHKLNETDLRKIVEKEVNEYHHYLSIGPQEKEIHVELIMASINANSDNLMGARAIQNAVQQFYEEKMFNAPFDKQLRLILNVFEGDIE